MNKHLPTADDKTELSLDKLLDLEAPRPRLLTEEEAEDNTEEVLDVPRSARGLKVRVVVGGGSGSETEAELELGSETVMDSGCVVVEGEMGMEEEDFFVWDRVVLGIG